MANNATYEIHLQSLSDQVCYYIKRLILSGEIRGGDRIPEKKVTQQFGVSRTPIREALSRLEEYGLIQIKPRSYAEVVALEPHEAGQLAVIRSQLETLAVSLLADCGTEEDFRELDLLAKECNALITEGDIATTFEKKACCILKSRDAPATVIYMKYVKKNGRKNPTAEACSEYPSGKTESICQTP